MGRGRGPHRPDRRGARLRPQEGHHPPRHKAGEHPDDDRRQDQDHRLRHRQGGLVEPDDHGAVSRHAELHVARAGLGRARGRTQRHLLARRRPLRDADQPQAVLGRQPHGDLLQDRPRGLHAARRPVARHPVGLQPDRRARDGQGSVESVSARQGHGARALPVEGAPRGAEGAAGSGDDGVGGGEPADAEARQPAGARRPGRPAGFDHLDAPAFAARGAARRLPPSRPRRPRPGRRRGTIRATTS